MEETIQVKIGDLIFDCRTQGSKEDELIIFLHGFPETSYMWKRLMSGLSENGFYCVAPNLRGYSKGACPKGKKHYTLDKLANDVLDIAEFLNKPKFHLVGHDWGAAIGWKVVHDHQDAIYLPEMGIRKNDFKIFRKLWKHSESHEIDDYLEVFRNPEQLTASLNYYRSNYKLLKTAAKDQILGDINVPTLFIWGNKDVAIGSYSVNESHQYMKNDYEFIELDAGHWLIQTNYQELKEAITKHIDRNKNGT